MSKSKKIKIIITIVCISFIQGLQFCVSPVLGQIQEHYQDASVSMVQMLVTAPTFLSIVVAIISGGLVVKISKKKMLIFAGLMAGITGFLPFLADSFMLLFVSRILYGLALGLCIALNTAVVAEFFEGDERVSVMGIQAASVGAGMVLVSTLGGALGKYGFQNAYYLNVIGFIAMILIALFLPETGTAKVSKDEKIELNSEVYKVAFIGTTVSGNLTGVFSGAQIVMGLILGAITKVTKKYTLPVAMLCFSIGGALLLLFPSNYVMLMIGAVFCGFSQGMFIPTAMVEVSNAVNPASTTMAAACMTCGNCFGQLISPTLLNGASKMLFGEVTTSHVYLIATVGMTIAAGVVILLRARKKTA